MEKAKKLIEEILKKHSKNFKVDENSFIIYDKLCRLVFVEINTKIKGLDAWYYVKPYNATSFKIKIIRGDQIDN